MAGFLILDFDLFSSFPQLSDGARILYAFIIYRMRVAQIDDADGQKYITYHVEDDPRPVLAITKKQLLKRSEELKAAGLIITEGNGWAFKLKLGAQKVTEDNIKEFQKGNRDGAQKVTELNPKGNQDGAQKVTEPFNINIEKNRNIENNKCVNTPSLDEVKKEIAEKKYKIQDPEKFILYNDARNWTGVVNWKKALELWAKNEIERTAGPRSGSITGAEAGIIYNCPVEVETYQEPQAENITAEDAVQNAFADAIDAMLEMFGGD